MTSVGEILRAERERQNLTIAQIADQLCLTPAYVRSMESDDVAGIPGFFFYKSFVRQYCALLGLEPLMVQSSLPAVVPTREPVLRPEKRGAAPKLTEVRERLLSPHSTAWAFAGLLAVLISCSAFYEWWMQAPQPQSAKTQTTTQTRKPVQPSAPSAPQSPSPNSSPEPQIAAQTIASSSTDAVKNVVLDVAATERTWLRITSGGQEIFSGILQPSESRTLSAWDGATMRIGNAAGIEVRWNGKPVGPLGTRGQVRTVHFTPQQFEIVPPAERL
jgi:cytoskeleton protein RodZ